jgi:hypothetical protein
VDDAPQDVAPEDPQPEDATLSADDAQPQPDITPQDIQDDYAQIQQDAADDAAALDDKFNEQTDAPYAGEELHDEIPDDPEAVHELREATEDFSPENWDSYSPDDQKEAIQGLADYCANDLGIENPPEIEYYYNEDPGDFGSSSDGVISINEYTMGDGTETADTIAHEMRHQYQSEQAANPESTEGQAFRDSLDNYISPEDDFDAYQQQLVESDARDYASRFRDMIK